MLLCKALGTTGVMSNRLRKFRRPKRVSSHVIKMIDLLHLLWCVLQSLVMSKFFKKSLSSFLSSDGTSKPWGLTVVTGFTVRVDPALISEEGEYFMMIHLCKSVQISKWLSPFSLKFHFQELLWNHAIMFIKKMLFDNILTIIENKERHKCVLEIHLNLVVHS